MTHHVLKPFHAQEAGRILHTGEAITPADEVRAKALIRGGLIAEGVPPKREPVAAEPRRRNAEGDRGNRSNKGATPPPPPPPPPPPTPPAGDETPPPPAGDEQ